MTLILASSWHYEGIPVTVVVISRLPNGDSKTRARDAELSALVRHAGDSGSKKQNLAMCLMVTHSTIND